MSCVAKRRWTAWVGRSSSSRLVGIRVFADQVVAGAIIDRLPHNTMVINIKGAGYRMRRYADAQARTPGGSMR